MNELEELLQRATDTPTPQVANEVRRFRAQSLQAASGIVQDSLTRGKGLTAEEQVLLAKHRLAAERCADVVREVEATIAADRQREARYGGILLR